MSYHVGAFVWLVALSKAGSGSASLFVDQVLIQWLGYITWHVFNNSGMDKVE
jgi:hypothetical protein